MAKYNVSERFGLFAAERLLRLAIGFFVGIAVARYLGPSAFGALNYATATVAIFTVLMGVGTDGILVRDFAKEGVATNRIMAAAMAIRGASGCLLFLLCAVYAVVYAPASEGMACLILAQSVLLLFGWSDVIDLWFQADARPHGAVAARVVAGLLGAGVRIVLILLHAGTMAFVFANLVEAGLLALALLVALRLRPDRPKDFILNGKEVKRLLMEGWPLVISSVLVILTMQLDRLAVGSIKGAEELGKFAASARFLDIVILLPFLMGMAAQRVFVTEASLGPLENSHLSWRTMRRITLFAMLVAALVSITSGLVIQLSFGTAYIAAGPILAIHVWTAVFITHVSLRSRMLVAEGRQITVMVLSSATFCLQVGLLVLFVPYWGARGAALSSLVSWAAGVLIFPLFASRTRYYTIAFLSLIGLPQRKQP